MMEIEVIHGQIIAKANHYQAVPESPGKSELSKTKRYEPMKVLSLSSAKYIGASAFQAVSGYLSEYSIARLGSTWIIA